MSALPSQLQRPVDVLLIDNFDSFTYNLYQALSLLGRTPTVIRNDLITPSQFPRLKINALIISPGPGHPKTESGISRDAIKYFSGKVPVLGVCMGLECLVDLHGGEIAYAGEIMHGKLSAIRHDGRGIFKNLPQLFKSTRYHSLSASHTSLPADLMISAVSSASGVIMAVRHRTYTLEAVQYHPESVLSEHGDDLLRNFLSYKGGTWEGNPHSGVLDPDLPPFPIESLLADAKLPQDVKSKVPTILERIYAQRLTDVQLAKSTPGTTPADLSAALSLHLAPPLIPLVSRLKAHHITHPHSPALMAEIKRASPSKGPIALNASAPAQALLYALSGAAVISVLTEPTFFKGLITDLSSARAAVAHLPNRPAFLRKDFILDEYQIAEARLHGADTILLIVAMLPLARLRALYAYSLSLGMEPLVEVNNAHEMQTAIDLGAKVIGVNNRNLHDFKVDMDTTTRLADMVQGKDVILCALSGISSREDVQRYTNQGVGAVLVGEALMRAPNTREYIAELLDLPAPTDPATSSEPSPPLVKICGIRTVDEALSCASAGADMLGIMFVKQSKRCVSLSTAQAISSTIRSHRFSTPPSSPPLTSSITNSPWFTHHASQFPKERPLLVGVFQDQPLEEILETVSSVQLDLVQLHGNEPVDWARLIPVPVIKVFHVASGIDKSQEGDTNEKTDVEPTTVKVKERDSLEVVTRPGYHQFILLDSLREDSSALMGGSGKTFDWELAKHVIDAGEIIVNTDLVSAAPEVANHSGTDDSVTGVPPPSVEANRLPLDACYRRLPIILAGGLTPENVRDAVEKVCPWAVDVSGGVEMDDGVGKDVEKVVRFVKEAKRVKEEEEEEEEGV